MKGRGLIISAPTSGAGKTTVTLGLMRALRARCEVKPAKSGPDYIDPAFHSVAAGRPSVNLDAWAMEAPEIRALAATHDLLIIEGAMGLFDGAPPDGRGATADLAKILRLPVILVVDARAMSHSVAALVRGFHDHDAAVHVGGVILNRVGSPRHEAMLRHALKQIGIPVLGAIPRKEAIELPSRHLGLVQAREHADLEARIAGLAALVEAHVDLDALLALAGAFEAAPVAPARSPERIALADDAAFSFTYAHQRQAWETNADLRLFSPLADDPVPEADRVILPGGYPELHASTIAGNSRFLHSLKEASQSADIEGECGGYMVLGEALVDADGKTHKMAGLLGLETSFAKRKLHLGYRTLEGRGGTWRGHEFHYATTLRAEGTPLFKAWAADGTPLASMGLVEGRVSGSFAHLIAKTAPLAKAPE